MRISDWSSDVCSSDLLAEEFRLIKRQVLLTARAVKGGAGDVRSRMVLVCSANPDEGKTFSATNLAISLAAEKNVEVLLVEGDCAKPDLLHRLGIEEGPGLLDAIAEDRKSTRLNSSH